MVVLGDFNSEDQDSPCWLLRRGRLERNHTDACCPQVGAGAADRCTACRLACVASEQSHTGACLSQVGWVDCRAGEAFSSYAAVQPSPLPTAY